MRWGFFLDLFHPFCCIIKPILMFSNVFLSSMLQVRIMPAAPLQQVSVMVLNLSWPAVSHNWSRILLSPMVMVLILKSTPIVATQLLLKCLSLKRRMRLVLPTPLSPITITLNMQSYVYLVNPAICAIIFQDFKLQQASVQADIIFLSWGRQGIKYIQYACFGIQIISLNSRLVVQNIIELNMSEKAQVAPLQDVDIFEIFDKQQFHEAPLNLNSMACDKSLNLENNNSLALMARHSIQNGLPIPKNMLSHSEDAFQSQDESYQQKSPVDSHFKIEGAADQLINQLNLGEFIFEKLENTAGENTKNVLRNFGNAQNHYVLYNQKARKYLSSNMANLGPFDEWVRSLKLQNFENFKAAWGAGDSRLFKRVYKKLCWDFYTENAIPYVLSSRIKKSQTRNSHLRYVYRFLQGLGNPQEFNYFRKA